MKRLTKTTFVAAAISVVCALTGTCAAALPRTAKLLPPETVLFVDIGNFQQFKAQFEKTGLYRLYKDPAMAAFVADFENKWRRQIGKMDKNDIFRTIVDADVLPEGRVSLAVILDEQAPDSNNPPVLFITHWGQNISKVKEAVDKLVEKNIEMGGRQKPDEDYRGVTIKTLLDEDSTVLSYCFIDDCFLGSGKTDLLKFAIAHIKGADSPSLADDPDYTAVMAAVGPYHDIDLFVNIKQIVKTIIAGDSTGGARARMAALGFDNVAAAACSLGLARRPGSSWSGKAFVKVNGAKRGICKMLEFESAVLRAPGFVPASAYLVTILNLDINKAYDELYNALAAVAPMAAAMMNMPLIPPSSPQEQAQLRLKSDIIGHLGSQIVISQSLDKSTSAIAVPEYLFALGVSNRSALEKSMSLLHARLLAFNNPDAKRQLLGYTIYLVDPRGFPWFRPGPVPMQAPAEPDVRQAATLAFTITDTHLIFGAESTVEAAIRTLASPGATSVDSAKWFREARLSVPTVVGLAGLEDTSASSELLWQMLRQSAKKQGLDLPVPPGPGGNMLFAQAGLGLFDPALLPEFDAVRKYFGSSTLYGISRPDGFFFEFVYLNPPADR